MQPFKFILIFILSLSMGYTPANAAGTFIKGPALVEGFSTITSAAGTTALTKDSETKQIVTGTTTQTITLPSATTLSLGRKFQIINRSTAAVTVNDNASGLLLYISGGSEAEFHLRAAGSAAGTWDTLNRSVGSGQITTPWVAETPVFSNFGTVTAINIETRRNGPNLEVRGKFTAGTTAAGEARMTLPAGLVTSASVSTIHAVGNLVKGSSSATAVKRFVVLNEPPATYFTFSADDYTNGVSPLAKINANAMGSSGEVFSIYGLSVPIQGWETGGTILSLNGMPNFFPTYGARIANSGTASITSQSGTWISSASRISAGRVTLTAAAGIFSSAPSCNASSGVANAVRGCRIDDSTITATNIDVYCDNGAAAADLPFSIECTSATAVSAPMPIVTQSVSTNGSAVERVERLSLTPSVCSSSPCSIASQSGSWVSSVTRTGTGTYAVFINSGIFSGAPTCAVSGMGVGGSSYFCQLNGNTAASQVNVACISTPANTQADTAFHVLCMGPR